MFWIGAQLGSREPSSSLLACAVTQTIFPSGETVTPAGPQPAVA
jgi:hypothetical protein